ncbi:MAG: DUF305 domain-containing protein [Chitinophagaceae bacterium]
MLLLSFFIMYAVMFLNVDDSSDIYVSLTRLYMALLMVSPMAVLMVLLMGRMYPSKKQNGIIIIVSVAIFLISLALLRLQVSVSDIQYMKAMIPHHSSAIMTSKNASLRDPEVRRLADSIIVSQEREILQMKEILRRIR